MLSLLKMKHHRGIAPRLAMTIVDARPPLGWNFRRPPHLFQRNTDHVAMNDCIVFLLDDFGGGHFVGESDQGVVGDGADPADELEFLNEAVFGKVLGEIVFGHRVREVSDKHCANKAAMLSKDYLFSSIAACDAPEEGSTTGLPGLNRLIASAHSQNTNGSDDLVAK